MLIKTTHGDLNDHYFVGLGDEGDTQTDHDVTSICYKVWVMNTGNKMMSHMFQSYK